MARILVVDDDAPTRDLLRLILERVGGHEVAEAPDGKVALRIHRQEPVDLVVTDIIMPEKEGIETIREFRKDYPAVKIIAISGGGKTGPEQYLQAARGMGAMRTFKKPIKRDELLQAVNELLEEDRQ